MAYLFLQYFIVNQITNEFDFAEFGQLDEWKMILVAWQINQTR